jgi:hypothetical protein
MFFAVNGGAAVVSAPANRSPKALNFQVVYALASDEVPTARLQYVALPRGDLQWSRVPSVQLSLGLRAPIDGSVSATSRVLLDQQALNS